MSGYYEAGIFITYLAARYGWSSVAQLHGRVPPGSSAADVEAGFASVYPVSMDEAWKAAQSPANPPTCETDWVCAGTPLAVGQQASADCDGEVHRRIDVSDSIAARRLGADGVGRRRRGARASRGARRGGVRARAPCRRGCTSSSARA